MSTASTPHPSSPSSRHDERAANLTVRWCREVPDEICSLGALEDADYADIVTATLNEAPADPEMVIHEVLDNLPRLLVGFIPAVQRLALGLRLQLAPSPDHLLGWRIAAREENCEANWIRIEAESWFLTGHVVMHVKDRRLSFASFVRYDRRLAAFVWPPVSLIHRQVALTLVRGAIRTQQSR